MANVIIKSSMATIIVSFIYFTILYFTCIRNALLMLCGRIKVALLPY